MKIGFKNYFFKFEKNTLKWLLELAQKNYLFAKYYYTYKRRREMKRLNGSPIILFQMGKVGSKTIQKSLKTLDLNMPVYHSHLLTKERIAETEQNRKKFFGTQRQSYLQRPWLNLFLRKQIDKGLDGRKWKIITLTREPIARNISTFFENLEVRCHRDPNKYEIKSDYYDIKPMIIGLKDVHRLFELFFDRLNHDAPLEFFDNQLKRVFGIDVYATEFQKKEGFKIYEDEKADVLLIRLENLNECAAIAFKEFLDVDNFKLIKKNIGANKVYAALYEKFKRDIILPNNYIEKIYSSKFMRHFYTEEEIKRFRILWQRVSSKIGLSVS